MRTIHKRFPFVAALLFALELEDYKNLPQHSSEFLGNQLNISLTEVEDCLGVLRELKLITRKERKFVSTNVRLDLLSNREAFLAGIRYWAQRSTSFLEILPESNYRQSKFGYKAFNVSEKAMGEILEEHHRHYRNLTAIVAKDTLPKKHIVVTNLQTFLPLESTRRV